MMGMITYDTDGYRSNEVINLLKYHEGTVPGSRGFGLAGDYIDLPFNQMQNELASELQEKCDTYIPDVSIAAIDTDYNLNGTVKNTIHIERRD